MLKEVPISERPREKALVIGIENLSDAELLAIILRTGSKKDSVINVAYKLLNDTTNLYELSSLSINELTKIKGIGETKAITLLSAFELGKRAFFKKMNKPNFLSADAVYKYMKPVVVGKKEECLYAMYLDTKGNLINTKLLTKGTINSTIIDGKLVFKWAYKLSATAIILIHNHPSGDPTPSIQDIKYTEIVIKQSKLTEFKILDHIIIGDDYFSMKKECQHLKLF